ncbi:MAG: lipoyl synthase [Verrucomicrobia bacterium]|nr:lipoyl synthase [Verrucomicrobiota bacterium]
MTEDRFDNRPKVQKNPLPLNPDSSSPGRFPSWLHRKMPKGGNLFATGDVLQQNRLHTVCEEAKCPNLLECWSRKTATFLVMGKECTRACGFCDIATSTTPAPLEEDEPERIALSVEQLGLKHVVITMVARDDLPDGGAHQLHQIVLAVKARVPSTNIELLTSDFAGNWEALEQLLQAEITVFNHNVETVEALTPRVRHKATYRRSMELLRFTKAHGRQRFLKSGMMIGLGESLEQVHQTLLDLRNVGCDIVTIGQYLQPNRKKLTVKEFIHPDQFKAYADYGHSIGIPHMYCGPFVRSSYNADLLVQ